MPREFQKKRRKANKDGISTAQEDVAAAKVIPKIKPTLPAAILEEDSAVGQSTVQVASSEDWPLLDPDTKAYWKQIEGKILELERLGITDASNEDPDTEDERKILLRTVLTNLLENEIGLATDPDTSIVVERLIYSTDDYSRRQLAQKFLGRYADLARHQYASHVLQTLFTLGAATAERETRGQLATSSIYDVDPTSELPSMTSLLVTAIREFIPSAHSALRDIYASHLIRSALLLLSGKPMPTATNDRNRSNKSKKWKASQAPLRALILSEEEKGKGAARVVPDEFEQLLGELVEALDVALGKGTLGQAARQAATEGTAGVVVQMLLTLENEKGCSDVPGSLMDRLLLGLITSMHEDDTASPERKDFLDASLREQASAHTFELILSLAPKPVFDALWSTYFVPHVSKLAGHPVANFLVAKSVERLALDQVRGLLVDLTASETGCTLVENHRAGTLTALLERSLVLPESQGAVVEFLYASFKLEEEQRVFLVPCAMSLMFYNQYAKSAGASNENTLNEPSLQGALLLQSWLKLSTTYSSQVVASLCGLPIPQLVAMGKHPVASHVIDAALESPTVSPKDRRKLLLRFSGHYHELADDRLGSRVADKCWATADVFLKDKIAESLVGHDNFLLSSHFGHYFLKKVQLPLHQRRREEWKAKMVAQAAAAKAKEAEAAQAVERQAKKRKAPDEIDELFAAAKPGKKASKSHVKRIAAEVDDPDLQEVFGALKASAQ